ncbi:MAG: very short patch repair endonuclease [Syntrophobacteraceae bacterium]
MDSSEKDHQAKSTDIFTPAQRSQCMSKIKGKNTAPELAVRSLLHRMGFRFRIHAKDLPGCPDIVLPKYRSVIFVHGCFWHQHAGCKYAYTPKTRRSFWHEKLRRNVERHGIVAEKLTGMGWRVITIWECELSRTEQLLERFASMKIAEKT